MQRFILSSLFFLSLACFAQAQEIVGPTELWTMVSQRHPIARQALVLEQQARQVLRQARGAFDPKLYANQDQKTFGGSNYFNYGAGGLKWASPFALELKAEFNWSDGIYLNPERNLPEAGQGVLGLSLPLGQGLFIDERRAALRIAEWADDLNAAQANTLRNDLFLETNKAYWEWAWSYHALSIIDDALAISQNQLNAVREGFLRGKDPAIDTLESFLQVQTWMLDRAQAQLALANAEAQLSVFLWSENGRPEPIPATWTPLNPAAPIEIVQPDSLLQALDARHPELLVYNAKLSQLAIERRWKAEQLKPQLDISYNFLGDAWQFGGGADDQGLRNLLTNNCKLGFQFQMPILLRKERSGLALADLKIAEANWQLNQKRQELRAKVIAYSQTLATLNEQVALGQQLAANYRSLLDAEQIKFSAGASSIFLLNSRQQKLLDARLKLLKFQAERHKTIAALRWAAGTGGQ
jgi:outer membrane protein TolC